MKKILLISIIGVSLFLTACSKKDDILEKFYDKVESLNSYYIKGELEIINNEDNYLYDVEVAYAKDNLFRVALKNQVNSHEQIILKNEEGVFVLTPSLNKSFKFQSEWPYNNSQIYLLQTIMEDLKNDEEVEVKESDNGFIATSKVDYSNNHDLVKQSVYFNEDGDITNVNVMNSDNIVLMKMTFSEIKYNHNFDDQYFALEENMQTSELDETSSEINEIIYPMYLPTNTFLSNQSKVSTEDGERVILTFSGDNSFMMVQENIKPSEEYEVVSVYGDPCWLGESIGVLTDTSATWMNNGIEYYIVGNNLDEDQLVNIASSISAMPIGK